LYEDDDNNHDDNRGDSNHDDGNSHGDNSHDGNDGILRAFVQKSWLIKQKMLSALIKIVSVSCLIVVC
jgi:hypothetical protein